MIRAWLCRHHHHTWGRPTHLRLVHPHLPTLPPLRHIRRRENDVRTGCLFSGYGGLSMAVNAYFDSRTAWFSEYDAAPSKILAHHWPDIPNHGDITTIDWSQVEPVDILTGGFPCQDVSAAGRRAGLMHGTRTGLFHNTIEAIDALRPQWVVLENVTGLLSADGEPWSPELVKLHDAAHDSHTTRTLALIERTGGYAWGRKWNAAEIAGMVRRRKRALDRFNAARRRLVQRAIGTVAGELATIGYDAQWTTVAASSVGACHRRERVFIVATPADAERCRLGGDARTQGWESGRRIAIAGSGESSDRGQSLALLPTPRAAESKMTMGAPGAARHVEAGNGALTEVLGVQLLPTPNASDASGGGQHPDRRDGHEAAIRRHETVTNTPAPPPTEPNRNGNPRLSARFVEWMMMLPAGHVTDPSIGLTRNQQLKALGNGVMPSQAYAALGMLVPIAQQVAS